jgi:hypothetical protein
MSSGGKSGGTTTTTSNLPAWLEPYAKGFIGSYGQQAFGPGFTPGEPGTPIARPEGLNQQVAGFNPYQQAAMQNIAGLTGGGGIGPAGVPPAMTNVWNPNMPGGGGPVMGGPQMVVDPAMGGGGGLQGVANLGAGETARTLSGQYLDPASNPWLGKTYEMAAAPMVSQFQTATMPGIMAAAQRQGQFGSSAMTEAMNLAGGTLGKSLSDLSTQIYGGNYQQERARQMQTMGLLPQTLQASYYPQQVLYGMGAQQQEQSQAELDAAYQNAVGRAEWPFNILSGFGGALGQAGSGAGTSTTTSRGSGGK